MKIFTVPHVLAFLSGLGVMLALDSQLEVQMPFASALYYLIGWPVLCAIIAGLAKWYPERAWRWTVSMALGQGFSVIPMGQGDLVPVALAFVFVLSLPQFFVGSWVSQRTLGAQQALSGQQALKDHNDEIQR